MLFDPLVYSSMADVSGLTVKKWIASRLEALHAAHPAHEMFGKIEKGMIRMPFDSNERKNAQCWKKLIKDIYRSIPESKTMRIHENRCWMTKKTQVKIYAKSVPVCLQLILLT